MALILAIETATDVCSAAVISDHQVLAVREVEEARGHAEKLVPMIQESMEEAALSVADLGAIAVSSGPGSYTGLRIGISTAKGLAFAADIPIISVPTIKGLVYPILQEQSTVVVGLLPSRRNEVFAAAYQKTETGMERVLTDAAVAADDLQHWMESGNVHAAIICGPGVDSINKDTLDLEQVEISAAKLSAESVGFTALEPFKKQIFEDTSNFEPYYLREFETRRASTSIFDRLPF